MQKKFWQDTDIENIIGNLLRIGVIISSFTIIIGGIIFLWHHGKDSPDYNAFHGLTHSLDSFSGVLSGVLKGRGQDIIQLGVLLLIATPVARIMFSIFGFIEEKDRLYIVITIIVLLIIISSMLFGFKG